MDRYDTLASLILDRVDDALPGETFPKSGNYDVLTSKIAMMVRDFIGHEVEHIIGAGAVDSWLAEHAELREAARDRR